MGPNQVWKSKEAKSYILKIMHQNQDGTIKVTFDFGLNPKRTHNYTLAYLEQYYEYAGYESYWVLGKGLTPIVVNTPVPKIEPVVEAPVEKSELDKAFETLDPEKVLFGDYTKTEKVNVWKEVQ